MSHRNKIAAGLTGLLVAASSSIAVPVASAADDSDLSLRTQVIDGFWDGVDPVLDVKNPGDDKSFYGAPAGTDFSVLEPGMILRERTFQAHVATMDVPVTVTQLLYVTTNILGEKEENVTSILHPVGESDGNVMSYQSYYDSTNPGDSPSREIAGNMSTGSIIPVVESPAFAPALLRGHPVVVADVQGKDAYFAGGPAYGAATLDSLRAATNSKTAPVDSDDQIGLFGYSGGSIATTWATLRVHDYAPELEPRIVGAAQGGLFVNPGNNLQYAGHGIIWSGVVGLALTSLAEQYRVDISQYFNDYGMAVAADVKGLSIIEALARYPELTWQDVAKPEYPTPESAPDFKRIIDELNALKRTPSTFPMMVFQGAGGFIEGTPESKLLGPGDGVMVTRDVRTLVHQGCEAGAKIEYREYPYLSHFIAMVPWLVEGYGWLEDRFNGVPATNNCATVPPGNPA